MRHQPLELHDKHRRRNHVRYMKDGTNVVKTICDFDDAWAKYQGNPSNKDDIYDSVIPWKKAVLVFVHR